MVLSTKFNLFYDFNAHVTYFILCPCANVIEPAKHEHAEMKSSDCIKTDMMGELDHFYLKTMLLPWKHSAAWYPFALQRNFDSARHIVGVSFGI